MKHLLLVVAFFTFSPAVIAQTPAPEVPSFKRAAVQILPASTQEQDFSAQLIRELEKRENYQKSFNALTISQREKNLVKATHYHKKGRALFQQGDTRLAQRYYAKAISLNPYVDLYYYEMAISAYRNGEHQRSLVLLEMVRGTQIDATEISYYEALNNMKLNDLNPAIKTFGSVMAANDPELSPSAAMYRGILLKQNRQYAEAKESFQYVLDTTKDKDLDKKAEQQLEEILALQRFEEESKKRFAYSLFTGAMYDSNVLNITDNNSALDLKAYRLLYGGVLEYKAIHKAQHSLTPRLTASDLYSVDTSFDSNATIQSTDPLQAEIAVPYSYRFNMYSKPSTLTVIPAYSNIFMSLDEQNRDLVYSTGALAVELSTSLWNKWLHSYRLDFADDTFHFETAPENDQTSNKYGLTVSNSRLFNTAGTRAVNFDLNYLYNDAEGINSLYDRLMLSLGGTFPTATKLISYGKFDYIRQDFSKSTTNREDNGMIFTVGSLYSIKNNLNLNMYVQYYKNSSTLDMYDFNKITVMTMISYTSGFF